MQKQITITILAEDIRNNSYFGSSTCPITRALRRAGYDYLQDVGIIEGKLNGEFVRIDTTNADYNNMLQKVFGMYNSKADEMFKLSLGVEVTAIPIEDFTVTINF